MLIEESTFSKLSPVEFSYWLQGAIEIGSLGSFTKEQAELMLRRAESLKKADAFIATVILLNKMFSHDKIFETINKDLQAKFIHEIDPSSYDGDQQYFQDIHDGKIEK